MGYHVYNRPEHKQGIFRYTFARKTANINVKNYGSLERGVACLGLTAHIQLHKLVRPKRSR